MRKILITALGIALILLVPAAAATSGSAESAKSQHVKRFVLHQSAAHPFDAHHVVGTDVLRRAGKIVGYDSFTERSHPRTQSVFRFALALKGGIIVGRVVQDTSAVIGGPILFGSGMFAGITGTATLNINRPNQVLILRYQL